MLIEDNSQCSSCLPLELPRLRRHAMWVKQAGHAVHGVECTPILRAQISFVRFHSNFHHFEIAECANHQRAKMHFSKMASQ